MGEGDLRQTLSAIEEQGRRALAQGTGVDFYWRNLTIEDPHVATPTDDSAALTYRAMAQRAGQGPYSALIATAFVRHAHIWKTALHQQTPVSG